MKKPMLVSKRNWLLGVVAVGVVAIIAVSVMVVGLNSAGAEKGVPMAPSGPITVDEAMEAVRQFEGASLPDLELANVAYTPDGSNPSKLVMLKCDGAKYGVNLANGMVEVALYRTSRSSDVMVSEDEARSIATRFAEESRAGFSALAPVDSQLCDRGTYSEYDFKWAEVIGGATTPNMAYVSVNAATGEVTMFVSKYLEIEPFASPSVTKGDAQAIATAAFEEKTGKGVLVSEPVLEVTLEPDWIQHLVWRVVVDEVRESTELTNSAVFLIEAHTGEILVTGMAG